MRPSTSRAIRPAFSNALICLETAGSDMRNGAASSETETAPALSLVRILRRVGSASAANTRSNAGAARFGGKLTIELTISQRALASQDFDVSRFWPTIKVGPTESVGPTGGPKEAATKDKRFLVYL
jgi:hypothetical protein